MYDYDPADSIIRSLRPAKDHTAKHEKPPKNAYTDYKRKLSIEYQRAANRRNAHERTDRIPTPFTEKQANATIKVCNPRLHTDFNLTQYDPHHLYDPSTFGQITLDLGCCAPPGRAFVLRKVYGNLYEHDVVLLGNYNNTVLCSYKQLLQLEQTGSVSVSEPTHLGDSPFYLKLQHVEDFNSHVAELDALFPRVEQNIYLVPRQLAKQLLLVDYTADVPINLGKFLYLASVGGMTRIGAAKFLSHSEYFYHFRLFRRMLENKLIEVPQLYKYVPLQQHQDAPDYTKRQLSTFELDFPAFEYHDDAPCYS